MNIAMTRIRRAGDVLWSAEANVHSRKGVLAVIHVRATRLILD